MDERDLAKDIVRLCDPEAPPATHDFLVAKVTKMIEEHVSETNFETYRSTVLDIDERS